MKRGGGGGHDDDDDNYVNDGLGSGRWEEGEEEIGI